MFKCLSAVKVKILCYVNGIKRHDLFSLGSVLSIVQRLSI